MTLSQTDIYGKSLLKFTHTQPYSNDLDFYVELQKIIYSSVSPCLESFLNICEILRALQFVEI